MTYQSAEKAGLDASRVAHWVRWFFKALYKFSGRKAEIAIAGQIEALNALSDAELAEMGVERDRINHYVISRFMQI